MLDLLLSRSEAWQSLWTLYFTVSVGILGVVGTGKILPRRRAMASLVATIGFLAFAIGNYLAMDAVREQRELLVLFVQQRIAAAPELVKLVGAAAPPSAERFAAYHFGLSALVVAFIALMPRWLGNEREA